MTHKILAQGAEAIIYKKDNQVIKDRIKKSYRIPELDNKIRKRRTKKEIKLLIKASKVISVPLPLTNNLKGRAGEVKIIMPFISGKKLSEHLDKFPLTKQKQICKQIGQDVAKLHNADIIHGDLTTSNMILVEKLPAHPGSQINKNLINQKNKQLSINKSKGGTFNSKDLGRNKRAIASVYFIDFGLGFISKKIEDKAVDIHLLKQALEAKHFKNWKILFEEFVNGYQNSVGWVGGNTKESKKILERLKAVEKRGRYKH